MCIHFGPDEANQQKYVSLGLPILFSARIHFPPFCGFCPLFSYLLLYTFLRMILFIYIYIYIYLLRPPVRP
ncbi:unnamed protein product [Acanthoscelides obtectus]|uniref:Uncharacterized protein n=1 Tax=Acanthoscelides obtectus TaxID=200917 RepID=A0A9P0LIF6_ACAOB|nr:unnamed protein product [Acanthoscelides obtectus]CAK1648288.1 hypothetical protein AOBTE_LOCUS15650 [Acanthoscelides obtectus]